jgi:hypothetical protein
MQMPTCKQCLNPLEPNSIEKWDERGEWDKFEYYCKTCHAFSKGKGDWVKFHGEYCTVAISFDIKSHE